MTRKIDIVEVGPRDGLQNEKVILTVSERVELLNRLSLCGFREIEVGSFVSPKWIPQMAHTDDVFQKIHRQPSVCYSALVPNDQGLEKAISSGFDHISIFTAASDAFTQKNINCTIEESFERFIPLVKKAKAHHIKVRGYVSCVVACPYSGIVTPQSVRRVAKVLWEAGCYEISLGDTIGKGTGETIAAMVKEVAQDVPVAQLAIHCHDTYGQALKNIQAAVELGIGVVDSALNGIGGCPYGGEKAKGNVATQQVLTYLENLGYSVLLHKKNLQSAAEWLQDLLAKKNKETP